ncbi:MAG TPA: hypothetical protein VEW67_04155 [Thermoleophilaceae bacterium]|nr:hypothetical protein [Thermoleophilaceae bacterium]
MSRPTSEDLEPAMLAARAALEAAGFDAVSVVVTAVLPNGERSWVVSSDPARDPGDWTPTLVATSLEGVANGIRARETPVGRHGDGRTAARSDRADSTGAGA